ncbi:hypothetical protein ACRAWF_38835 [Streptomyces sp. L7]
MGRGLHGRGALFEAQPPGLASRLTGLRPYQLLTSPYEHPEPPFVVLAGARGLGKSTVLAELRTAYRGHTPVALVDCEADRLTRLPDGRPAATWSPVWQALTTIAEQLREPVVHGAGAIDFPRLEAGLLAVCATGWDARDEDSAREEARRILLLSDPARRWSVIAQGWATRVASRLIANVSGTGPVGQAFIEATLDTLFDLVWTPNGLLKAGADWYRDYPGASGDPKRGLIEIARDFRADGTSRTDAERWPLRALLADLGDTYRRRWERMRRVGRPVVLVDNVQSGPGPGLMKAVLKESFRRCRRPGGLLRGAARGPAPRSAGRGAASAAGGGAGERLGAGGFAVLAGPAGDAAAADSGGDPAGDRGRVRDRADPGRGATPTAVRHPPVDGGQSAGGGGARGGGTADPAGRGRESRGAADRRAEAGG